MKTPKRKTKTMSKYKVILQYPGLLALEVEAPDPAAAEVAALKLANDMGLGHSPEVVECEVKP